jgi:CheY-like chemotaxis protein
MLEAIFDMFGQVNRKLARSQEGLGIGLALVRRLVTLHGGTIHAESPGLGKGSTFVVRLPLLNSATPATTDMSHNTPPPKQDVEAAEILVVDDNPDGAESLAMYLGMLGHKVSVVHNGTAAIAVATKKLPRKIFLDIGLPDMSGYEVAEKIRRMPHGSEPYIVAVTGWGTDEDKRRSVQAGCNEHLRSPSCTDPLSFPHSQAAITSLQLPSKRATETLIRKTYVKISDLDAVAILANRYLSATTAWFNCSKISSPCYHAGPAVNDTIKNRRRHHLNSFRLSIVSIVIFL